MELNGITCVVFVGCLLLIFAPEGYSDPVALESNVDSPKLNNHAQSAHVRGGKRVRRSVITDITPNNRTLCPETPETRPPNRVDTATRVADLRAAMNNVALTGGHVLDAYIVTHGDEHGSGGSDYYRRIRYISGFGGSTALAIVTHTQAAMWTDGRYFLQADLEMDCGWTLMKSGEAGYPLAADWLAQVLPPDSKVGTDPKLITISTWETYQVALDARNISMIEVTPDLISHIWTSDRPPQPNNPLIVHPYEFTGRHLEEKIQDVRNQIDGQASALVVTALDETAWLFNLRGSDMATSPLYYSYAIITADAVSLFIRSFGTLLAPEAIRQHLKVDGAGNCWANATVCIRVFEYDTVFDKIREMSADPQVTWIWLSGESNYAVLSEAGSKKYVRDSPIQLMKAVKNSVERARYYDCQVRDSAALMEFIAILEREVKAGTTWTELSASDRLTQIRSIYDYNMGISFDTISAVGPNAAVIHYRPSNVTDTTITTNDVYLLDSGGQYMDGTTDVTRTFHFGTPTDMEKEAYTRVLMGVIDLAVTVWPRGIYGRDIDGRARAPIWENGWDYRHGTGHGIGYWLNVHEGPGRINLGYNIHHSPLYEGMFFSDEPGYYEDGKFGIRLETIVGVVKANTTYNFGGLTYLTFLPYTLVPFEPNLIKYELLNAVQRRWLNIYNARCVAEAGKYLQDRNKLDAYNWLTSRTAYVPDIPSWESTPAQGALSAHALNKFTYCAAAIVCIFMSVVL